MQETAAIERVDVVEQRLLHHERHAYCAHPHMAVAADGIWLCVFNRAPKREMILHPPQDPEYRNVLMRSFDEGRSWTAPAVVPDYDWSGVECAGLTALRDGRVLLNQWRFEWLPLPHVEQSERRDVVLPAQLHAGLVSSPELDVFAKAGGAFAPADAFPWARSSGRTVVHASADGGRSFNKTTEIDTTPFSGGYGMRGALELADGDILLPLSDVPNYRAVFTVRSSDGGATWSTPTLVARGTGHEFEEPAGLVLPSGRIVLMLRDNATRILHAVTSDDDGHSWSAPRATGITGYPADLQRLPDGRIACVTGRREPPFGIVLNLSEDGIDWTAPPIALVDDLPTKDLGYPTLALRKNGDLVVVYYAQESAGITGIHQLTARLS